LTESELEWRMIGLSSSKDTLSQMKCLKRVDLNQMNRCCKGVLILFMVAFITQ